MTGSQSSAKVRVRWENPFRIASSYSIVRPQRAADHSTSSLCKAVGKGENRISLCRGKRVTSLSIDRDFSLGLTGQSCVDVSLNVPVLLLLGRIPYSKSAWIAVLKFGCNGGFKLPCWLPLVSHADRLYPPAPAGSGDL